MVGSKMLSDKARVILQTSGNMFYLSSASVWEVAIKHRNERSTTRQHLLQLFTANRNATQGIIVRQHTDNIAIGDVAGEDIVTNTTSIL